MSKYLKKNKFKITLTFIVSLLFTLLNAGEVAIDSFEDAKLSNWYSWPRSKISLDLTEQSKNGKKALLVDMREQAGVVVKTIYCDTLKGRKPYAINFWLKAAEGNQKEQIGIILEEKNGKERYYAIVKLPQEWEKKVINFSDLKIYRYGSAKIVDEKLDTDDIINIRFYSYPKGALFCIDDIKILTNTDSPAQKAKDSRPLQPVIKEIKLSEKYPKYDSNYPDKVQNVKVKNGNFERDGKPVFLLGGWQNDNEGPPWLFRTLSIDVYPYNATETYTLYPPKKKNGKLEISWTGNPWYEAIIQRTLKNGIMFWHEHKSHPRYNAIKKHMPEVVDSGHFVTYDHNNPWGIKFYKEMYKSWMQYTRKYPMFCYELFNEMLYSNNKETACKKFRAKMEKKYKNLEAANNVWATSFKSFEEVNPPGFIGNNNKLSKKSREVIILEESRKYHNLYIDWLKFQEADSEEAIETLMKIMRQYDKDPKKLSTVQSHCQLFTDYGDAGVNPEEIEKHSDFYSHEVGQKFFVERNKDSRKNIKDMIRSLLTNDIVRNICGKPIFNAEAPIHVSGRAASQVELESSDIAGLRSSWKFYDATAALPDKWFAANFNDSGWGRISVPGMWGKQGYNLCSTGLYRKHFAMDAKMLKKQEIYLNGKAFADKAEIYLNGNLIGKTKGFQSSFSFDISRLLKQENILAVKIVNNYFRNGMFYGGIRGYVTINDSPSKFKEAPSLQPKHFRAYLWSQLVHGMSGVMVCYDNNLYKFAARSLPRIKKEIESVSDIVLQRPRIKSQIAMVYPFETNRGVTHSGYIQKLSGPATDNLADSYAPMLFSGLGVDVIRNKDILSGKASKYKAIVMAGNIRVLPKELDALYKYASEGGVLVIDFGSLAINDNTHEAINPEKLLGIKVEMLSSAIETFEPGIAGDKKVKTEMRFADQKSAAKVKPLSAEVLEKFSNGNPAVTVNKIGKGRVYYIAGKLPYKATEKILKYVWNENGLKSQIELGTLSGKEPLFFVETNLFEKDGRYVLVALNWGKTGAAKVRVNSLPEGEYKVRNIATGNRLAGPGSKKTWSSEELKNKLALKMTNLDPVVLLIEKTAQKPLPIKNISPERYKILNQLWAERDSFPNAPVVAFAPEETMSSNYGDQPTADKLLNLSGYKTLSYMKGQTDLKKAKVLIWTNARHPIKNPEPYLNFIKNGGGMLICGNGMTNYHMKVSPIKPLLKALKTTQHFFEWLKTDKPAEGDDILNVSCKDISPHPLTKYVKEFRAACAGKIICRAKGAQTLIKAPKDSNIPDAPVMVAFSYGKGRVVYISDYWWMRPLNLGKGDNAQLFLNIVNWLADRPPTKIGAKMREDALYITAKKLEDAEKAEREGEFEFKPFSTEKSSLGKGGKLKGIPGGDPIVDMLE